VSDSESMKREVAGRMGEAFAPIFSGDLDPIAAAAEVRARLKASRRPARPVPVAHVEDRSVPGPAGEIPVRIYHPLDAGADTALPVLVYFHGGGFVLCDLDSHDSCCRRLANGIGAVVVSVDYRLAPEHPYPAAVEDSWAATEWVAAHAAELGADPARLVVAGDSAGGNLAAVVALALRDAAGAADPSPLAFQLLIYPATDMRGVADSHQRNGQGYVLTADTVTYFRGHYIADPAQYSDWRASPLLASSHRHLPPALVLTAGYDPLVDEGQQYADALSAAGNRVQYVCFERQIHGFVPMSRVLDEARTAVALCCAVLKAALGTGT
jgi:acetyl esterase